MEENGGDASDVYRALRKFMYTIHVPASLWGSTLEYSGMHVDEACATIWPVDVIEIAIEGGVRLPFADVSSTYLVQRVALVRLTYPVGSFLGGRFDYEWLVFDNTKPDNGTESTQVVSFLRDAVTGTIMMFPRANYGSLNPFGQLEAHRMRMLSKLESAYAQDQFYWGNVFRFCKRVADLTQHKGVHLVPISDPARPASLEERRLKEYAERFHFRLRMPEGQIVSQLLDDVKGRRNVHAWAQRAMHFSRQVDAHVPAEKLPRSARSEVALDDPGDLRVKSFGPEYFDKQGGR
jgi:hypothetical protein